MMNDTESRLIFGEEFQLLHYGVKRRSGRYPWGSGENPYQHSGDFLARVEELHKSGLSDDEIAKSLGMSISDLRMQRGLAKQEERRVQVETARKMYNQGLGYSAIGREMGIRESTVRGLLKEDAEARMNSARNTAEFLKQQVEEKGYIDIGKGVERELGISAQKLEQAKFLLQTEGYCVYGVGVPQVTNPGKQTNTVVLCPPDTDYGYLYKHPEEIKSVKEYHSIDKGESFETVHYPESLDSNRVMIHYGDQKINGVTGKELDGTIYIRRGVEDVSLGNSAYAQVRIMVDGSHYLKGMALYSDDLPKGVDVMFNTNKPMGTPKEKVFKPIKNDPDNPFGATIKKGGQSWYIGADGKKHLNTVNKIKEEGDWLDYEDTLASQFLAKQDLSLIKKQLGLQYAKTYNEYNDICKLDNAAVRQVLLKEFASKCDGKAQDLKAAALPRQKWQVILPVSSLKDNEIYAPNFKDGEKVVLVRYPHGGIFEIPELTVNNRNAQGKKIVGNKALDAVGINTKVAEKLSGADFDGDTVLVIPNNAKTRIHTAPSLPGLKDFDPHTQYAERPGMKYMTKQNTQMEMGKVSNLITDMTIKGANSNEIARAVRHSMVVIDAEKHKLDYQQSYIDNDILALKKKYQGHVNENGRESMGAGTLLSRAKSPEILPYVRYGSADRNEMKTTGREVYKTKVETYKDKNGKEVIRTTRSTKMKETPDAHTLSSGTPKESAYANYANSMKALANTARKEMANTRNIEYKPDAYKKYAKEVESLNAKLNVSLMNHPKERQAQILANSIVKAKKEANPKMDKAEYKRLKQQTLTAARAKMGADSKGSKIEITDSEWEAIQSGAVSHSKIVQILNNTDMDKVRERATPRESKSVMTSSRISYAKALANSGHTISEIADALGVSTSTISEYIN